jgi:hypothetical protein
MRIFLALILLIPCAHTHADDFDDTSSFLWMVSDTEKRAWYVSLIGTVRDSLSPITATVPVFMESKKGGVRAEGYHLKFQCNDIRNFQERKRGGLWARAVNKSPNSIASRVAHFGCGVRAMNAHWFPLSSKFSGTYDPHTSSATEAIYLDFTSFEYVGRVVAKSKQTLEQAIRIRMVNARFDQSKHLSFQPGTVGEPYDVHVSCTESIIFDNNGALVYSINDAAAYPIIRDLACNGKVPAKQGYSDVNEVYDVNEQKSQENQTDSINIKEAKELCSELGFSAGTEKHGGCVLKLIQ